MSIKQSLLGKSSRELIGLDISSSAVKLLELSRRGDRYTVESFAVEPLPPNCVNDRQITDPRVVGEVILKALGRAGTKNRQCAVAVAGSSVITKVITMPASLKDNDMEEQIKAEADRSAQTSIADAYREAEKLRGEGDAKTAEISARAYGADQEFYGFYRALNGYRDSFRDQKDVMVIEPKGEFFKYLKQSDSK